MAVIHKMLFLLSLVVSQVSSSFLDRKHGSSKQPIYEGKQDTDAQFGASAAADGPARPPGYRNAWDDCGGVGASATERMRSIAAGIKGWAAPLPFVRNAAQDCGSVDGKGLKPGPGSGIVYPGPEIIKSARDGLATAADTLVKYPPVKPPPMTAEDVIASVE